MILLSEQFGREGAGEGETFIDIFEQASVKYADRVAVSDRYREYQYGEINHLANIFAQTMRDSGIEPCDIVAIIRERDAVFLAAILAVFKVGAVYLPIHPDLPRQRQAYMLEQSRSRWCLFGPGLDFSHVNVQGFCLDDWIRPAQALKHTNRSHRADDLAYIIFTSGSTGQPKGAMIAQNGMLNHLLAKIEDLSLTQDDVVAQTASQAFDISVWQFLAVLLVGGKVVVIDREVMLDAKALLACITMLRVSVLETVPSHLNLFIDIAAGAPGSAAEGLLRLRWMISTGETLTSHLARRWFAAFPQIPLVNAYGPTECSDDVTHHILSGPPTEDTIPVGKEIRGVHIYIVNDQLEPVPDGDLGEICVAGVAVGLGYVGDQENTTKTFVSNTLLTRPHQRLYRSGDIGRRRIDGLIEYHGRKDQQVKINGHRVELGEIEAALLACGGLADVAVLVRRSDGLASLVAFIQFADPMKPIDGCFEATFLAALNQKLPSEMMPEALIPLEQFPVNANGKIDRRVLARMVEELTSVKTSRAVNTDGVEHVVDSAVR